MKSEVVTDVSEEPITLAMAWAQLSLDVEGSPPASPADAWLTSVGIPMARETAENFTGLALGVKTLLVRLAGFPDDDEAIELPCPPLVSVDSIEYADENGDVQTLGTGDFEIDETGLFPKVVPTDSWPTGTSVVVTYTVGYAPDAVPKAALWGMLLLLAHAWKNREAIVDKGAMEMPLGIEWALRPLRIRMGMA